MAKKKSYLEHLARVPMFSACSKRELELLARRAEDLHVDEGAVLVKEGDSGREFFVIGEGKARVSRAGKDLAVLGAGDFFGELSLLDRAPRNATVTAQTPLDVFVLDERSFAGLLGEIPTLSQKLLVGMARRLHDLDGRA
jgi:CRP-like cAMP-binding protein